MKLKGEKELLLEEVYNDVELSLYDITVRLSEDIADCAKKLKTMGEDDDAKNIRISISNNLEMVDTLSRKLLACRLVANTILGADFSCAEAKAIHKIICKDEGFGRLCSLVHTKILPKMVNSDTLEQILHNALLIQAHDIESGYIENKGNKSE